jgi:2-polyprenyl-6-methoxyphenol hydroxylase-like FAD-dependent oxidoreductase
MRVLIVGGGIGGLALAAFLRKQGISPLIVDKAHVWKAAGYGIALWPNGHAALTALGLGERIEQGGVSVTHQVLLDAHGKELGHLNLEEITQRYGPILAVNRSFLHGLLQDACAGIPVRLGTSVQALAQGDAVSATFSDGTTEKFDLVVGSDGIDSSVRGLLFPSARPRYMGMTSWLIWMPNVKAQTGAITVVLGNGKVFGMYPTNGQQHACGYFAMSAPPAADDPSPERIKNLKEHYSDLAGVMPEMLACLPEHPEEIFHHDHEQVDVGAWHEGRIALLGDAAHAFSPLMGMGASMAMEDAFVLSQELARSGDVPSALRAYASRRNARIKGMQRLSNTADGLLKLKLPRPLHWARSRLFGWMINGFYLKRIERILEEGPLEVRDRAHA